MGWGGGEGEAKHAVISVWKFPVQVIVSADVLALPENTPNNKYRSKRLGDNAVCRTRAVGPTKHDLGSRKLDEPGTQEIALEPNPPVKKNI